MTAKPFPVVQCDDCGIVTPGKFAGSAEHPGTTEKERLVQLRDDGWLIDPKRDLCARCKERERG